MANTNAVDDVVSSTVTITDLVNNVVSDVDVQSIAVTPAPTTVNTGTPTRQLTATALMSDGSSRDVSALATWVSDTPAAATVSVAGLVTKVGTGVTNVSATYGGASGVSVVTVS